jgi:hypothetical protein
MKERIEAFLAALAAASYYDPSSDSSEVFQGMFIEPDGDYIDRQELEALVKEHLTSTD